MNVKNVVILMLENRSFDEYFGTFPGANGFYNNPQSAFGNAWIPAAGGWTGPSVLPYRLSTFSSQQGHTPGCNHGWIPQHACFANGAMNGWAMNPFPDTSGGNPVACMGYYAADDIPYHWWLAQNFALCDNYFCSHMGVTEPNRLYMSSGKIDNSNQEFVNNPNGAYSPSPNWQSYADLLSTAPVPVSWKVYDLSAPGQSPTDFPGSYNAILNPFVYFSTWAQYVGQPQHYTLQPGAFAADAGTPGGLATVSWIIPNMGYSEHPSWSPWDGALFISQVLEALLGGDAPNWPSTVLIVTYDESDSHFDHVPPPQPPAGTPDEFIDGMSIGLGFRVPTFVISPWTVGRGVCSDLYDHTSILKFLESVTGVACPNISSWRRNPPFNSLLTIGFDGAGVPASSVPTRPNVGLFQTNAISRYTVAPYSVCPGAWQSTLTPSSLVPQPQTWPPVAQSCQVIMTIPSYSQSQVLDQALINQSGDTANFPSAFIVTVNGFEPLELTTPYATGLTGSVAAASPASNSCVTRIPQIVITDESGNPASNITWACTQIDFDPNNAANQTQSGVPRTFTFTYSLTFHNIQDPVNGPFSFGSGTVEVLTVNASFQVEIAVTSSAELELVTTDDPEFYHNFYNDTSWLSGELRVFSIPAGGQLFGVTLGDPNNPTAADGTDALNFIVGVINNLNGNQRKGLVLPPTEFPANSGHFVTTFDDLNQDEDTNPLSLFQTPAGAIRMFNFAVARVHMQAAVQANNVRVFFRSFRMSATDSIYVPTSSLTDLSPFRSNPPSLAYPAPGDTRIPLFGIGSVTVAPGQTALEYVTIPFFATVRKQLDTSNPGTMLEQQDIPNVNYIPASAGSQPTQTFFGCWLDINQSDAIMPIFVPIDPSEWDTGPWFAESILAAFTRDLHQCLVAEISFDGINIPSGDTPPTSAWLAQRNLGFTQQ